MEFPFVQTRCIYKTCEMDTRQRKVVSFRLLTDNKAMITEFKYNSFPNCVLRNGVIQLFNSLKYFFHFAVSCYFVTCAPFIPTYSTVMISFPS